MPLAFLGRIRFARFTRRRARLISPSWVWSVRRSSLWTFRIA